MYTGCTWASAVNVNVRRSEKDVRGCDGVTDRVQQENGDEGNRDFCLFVCLIVCSANE